MEEGEGRRKEGKKERVSVVGFEIFTSSNNIVELSVQLAKIAKIAINQSFTNLWRSSYGDRALLLCVGLAI